MSELSRVPFSWERPEANAAEQQLAVLQRGHEQAVEVFQRKKQQEQEAINQYQKQLDDGKQVVLRERAANRGETDRLRSERLQVENARAVVRRNRENVEKRAKELQTREEESKRNRTTSMVFLDDRFSKLSPKEVLEYLTHSSPRIREHVVENIIFCVTGFGQIRSSFVRFDVGEIAPFLLPKLDQLLSAPKPSDRIIEFAQNIVVKPEMAKALATKGQCRKLAEYLVRNNEVISRFAIVALREMMKMDAQVSTAVYNALYPAVSHIPMPDSPSDPCHPSVEFIVELSSEIIQDCFNIGRWDLMTPLVVHHSDVIRKAVLPSIVSEAASSDRVRHGLVEVNILRLLEHHYEMPLPPMDIIDFFVGLLPLLADMMCRHIDHALWLISRLEDPTAKITNAVIAAFRACSIKEDPAINDVFVKAELLQRLNETVIQETAAVTGLICHLLPVLALPHTVMKTSSRIVAFLDHAEDAIVDACLVACRSILDSTVEYRAELYSEVAKLDFSKESTLKLCDCAMPVFCEDWAAAGDFAKILRCLSHSQQRVRLAAHHVWRNVVSSSPNARAKIVHDGYLDAIFELCSSQYEDCVILGSHSLSCLAVEIAKAGPGSTRQLVRLLGHPRPDLRQAVFQAIHVIAESGGANCEILIAADTLGVMRLVLQRYPVNRVDITQKILVRLAPFFSESYDACYSLLQLLDGNVPELERAIRAALDWISLSTIKHRETLRNAIMEGLQLASDNLIEYSVKAIQEWIGPDLVELNNFEKLFQLASHSDIRIQNSALFSLKQKLRNREYQESLEKAEVVPLIRSLSELNNAEAISFVAVALRSLGPTFARHGHIGEILLYLTHEEPSIQEGAFSAIEAIANGSDNERRCLVDNGVLERLTGSHERLHPIEIRLTSAIIPLLAFSYVGMRRVAFVLALVDHKQEPIRIAALKSVTTIAGGTEDERRILRDALLPLLGGASAALRDVTSRCLQQSLARDLVSDAEYKQIFGLLANDDPQIRAPVISALQYHIQASGAVVRRALVDAGILDAILRASTDAGDDLVSFMAECMLPELGPFFSQNDGGASLIPLLKHEELRIRAGAVIAIRNGVESHRSNLQCMADARIISHLHSAMEDDNIRGLWCYLLPKMAPFLSNRREIDALFDRLSDPRPPVRQAASEAISIMAKTSDNSRMHLFPTLMSQLDGPPDAAVEQISTAVSLAGFIFMSTRNEHILLQMIEHGEPALLPAVIKAVGHVLSRGSTSEHQQLMNAEIFTIALRFHGRKSHRQLSLRLLGSIIQYLSYMIILHEELLEQLLYLFDDSDQGLSQTLYESLIGLARNPSVSASTTLLQLFPILLDKDRQCKPYVARLLSAFSPQMVPRLLELRMVSFIPKLLVAEKDTVVRSYLKELYASLRDASNLEKDMVAGEPQFVPALGLLLQSRDVYIRCTSFKIIELLSEKSPSRSAKLMEERIGSWLVKGGNETTASLGALRTLYLTAPDYADQLVEDSLPTLCDILEDVNCTVEISTSALCFLKEVAQRTPKSVIYRSGIVKCLITRLNPQHRILDAQCRLYVFEICESIAQNSDLGREALINENILPVLIWLAADTTASNVIGACNLLKALAHTGTYRSELMSAGVQNAMSRITSPFSKSSLSNKSDKQQARNAAKGVLLVLNSTKHVAPTARRSLSFPSPRTANVNTLGDIRPTSHFRRTVSEYDNHDTILQPDFEAAERPAHRTIGHARGSSDPGGTRGLRTLVQDTPQADNSGPSSTQRVIDDESDMHEEQGSVKPPSYHTTAGNIRASTSSARSDVDDTLHRRNTRGKFSSNISIGESSTRQLEDLEERDKLTDIDEEGK